MALLKKIDFFDAGERQKSALAFSASFENINGFVGCPLFLAKKSIGMAPIESFEDEFRDEYSEC